MLVWILITLFIFILITPPQQEGLKKPNFKKIASKATTAVAKTATKATTAVANTANKIGNAVAKIATAGLPPFVRNVLKHIGPIKKSLASFTKK
jgi:hypothetical protein